MVLHALIDTVFLLVLFLLLSRVLRLFHVLTLFKRVLDFYLGEAEPLFRGTFLKSIDVLSFSHDGVAFYLIPRKPLVYKAYSFLQR